MTPDHEIVIIGAGLSGIGCAIALREAGFSGITIFERAGDIGGTWRDNTYPGIGVDVPAQAYQFSYELKPDWSRLFAKGAEVKAYVDQVCDRYGIRPLIQFHSEIRARSWDERAHVWRLLVNDREVTARWVVSAIGPFVEPKPCGIPGADSFAGITLRPAAWDHSVSLANRRVAIIGTGASAVQIIPEIAREVAHLDVYQRTPIWVAPKLDPIIPRPLQALFRRAPELQDKVRRWFTNGTEQVLIGGVLDYQRTKTFERRLRWMLTNVWYPSQVRNSALRARLTPDYLIGCKRPAVSNTYLKTFTRDNVELVTDRIECITPRGVRTGDGRERAVDILILATGYRIASDPDAFRQRPVRGKDGFDLATFYDEHRAVSYESISMPQLPNHFMIFGPYGWTGGTWHQLVETASAHIVRVLQEARARGATSVEVRAEAAERWTAFVRERVGNSLLHASGGCASANSYYFDKHGDSPFIRPTRARDAWRAARTFPLDDYVFTALDASELVHRAPPGNGVVTGAFAGETVYGWDGRDVTGKRVAVIGEGASVVAIVPELVARAATVKVFSRELAWVVPERRGWLERRLVSRQRAARAHLRRAVADPWLRRQLTPERRASTIANDGFYSALQRTNCQLITWPIATLVAAGLRTADGIEHHVDCIVFAA